jgi:F0F1-type ATP synthase assembly protein I
VITRLPPTARLIGIGWYFAVCIVLGIGGGVALDKWLDTTPWLTLLCLALGLFFAFYGGYQMLTEVLAQTKHLEKDKEG